MKRLFLFLFISFSLGAIAQDAHFSQYINAPLYLNPATAGSWGDSRVTVGGRVQWPKLSNGFQTYNFSYDQYVRVIRGGLAINAQHDVESHGIYVMDRVDCIYSGYIPMFKDSLGKAKLVLQPAWQFSWINDKIDWNKMTFDDMIDPYRGYIYTSYEVYDVVKRTNYDVSTGILVYSKRILAGIALHHLTEPDISFISSGKLPMLYTLHGSWLIGSLNETTKHFNFIPSFLYTQQQDFRNFVWGGIAKYDKYSVGLFRRNADAMIFEVGFSKKWFKIAYSFDLTTSDLKGLTGGAHEVHLIFKFNDKKWSKKILTAQHFSF